ncbi:GntR family transcriptional regulator [Brachybacterium sp. AOP42-C2-15]|uniref:GntR family transcriptional regulator n=1 Tax=unclassified Brachybacterium TaxID=2623841 RepID=UPI004033FDC4
MVAKFMQIADELRARIDEGEYPEQSALPKQAELAQEFSVNVNTMASALKLLEREGRVQSRRSRGTVVLPKVPLQKGGSTSYHRSQWTTRRSDSTVQRSNSGESAVPTELTTVGVASVDEGMAKRLNMVPGDDLVIRVSVIRDSDGAVTQVLKKHYAYAIAKGTLLMSEESGPADTWREFRILTDVGFEPVTIDERLHSRLPDADETRLMEVSVGEPIVEVRRRVYSASAFPIEYSVALYRASRFQWNYTFEVATGGQS